MKHILSILVLLLCSLTCHADYPTSKNEYVNDFAQLLDHTQEKQIKDKLESLEFDTGIELMVVTIDSYGRYETGAQSWEAFATGLFNHYGIGNLPDNDGIMLLVSTQDRKVRIELGAGYPRHYDNIMKNIIDVDITPSLKHGNYHRGISDGVDGIISATTKKVSFLSYYRWHIAGGLWALFCFFMAFMTDRHAHPKRYWFFMAMGGFVIYIVIDMIFNGKSSDGSGGGSSSGGGASGGF